MVQRKRSEAIRRFNPPGGGGTNGNKLELDIQMEIKVLFFGVLAEVTETGLSITVM